MNGRICFYPPSGGRIEIQIDCASAQPEDWELIRALLDAMARRAEVAAKS